MAGAGYLDWNGSLEALGRAHDAGVFALVIGPKGTGKTTLVREFAASRGLPIESANLSLRTREAHLVGTKTLEGGSVAFTEGILVRSMRRGGIMYLDELNAAEADVLLRLDEALDDRRELVLKESAGETVRAAGGWYAVATINPLSHAGTKELPPQLLSRFPARIRLEYPPAETEAEIVRRHAGAACAGTDLDAGIRLAGALRGAAAVEELAYAPSMRETIAYARLVGAGLPARDAAMTVFGNVYAQWGEIEHKKVAGIITSMFGGQ
ncbi:MAG: AAA family ATPase [Thaumarchaeota archaeon]|nr:AAA family ATPase [Nitrososphaerota archaeon]